MTDSQNLPREARPSPDFQAEVTDLHGRLSDAFGDVLPPVFIAEQSRGTSSAAPESSGEQCGGQVKTGGPGAARAAGLDLINTHIPPHDYTKEPPGPCVRVRFSDFGDDIVEAVAVRQSEPMPRPKKNRERKSTKREDMNPEQLRSSVQRSKRDMRHKAMMLKADRLLTLTYRENFTDRDEAYRHLEKFAGYMRKHFGTFPYVAVMEYQKRGAIHFHLAITEYYWHQIVRHYWKKATGRDGNIDLQPPKKRGQKNVVNVARYLAKYMAKDMEDSPIASKRYSSSRGIPKPDQQTFFIPTGPNTFRLIAMLFQRHYGRNFSRWAEVTDADRHILWFSTF